MLSEDNESNGMAAKVMQYELGWTLLYECKEGGKSAIDLKTPSEFGEKYWADSCLCEGFQLSVILQVLVPADAI